MSFMSDRQRESFERAERSYDRMLAAGPPEPKLWTFSVDYEVWLQKDQALTMLTEVLGGEAHWAGDETLRDSHRPAEGSTLIEDVESAEDAEEVVHALVTEHLRHMVDLDTLVIHVEGPDVYEPDWDAIVKDERVEREFDEENER